MTEWTPTIDDIGAYDVVPRRPRRSALRPAPSQRVLYANAREEARLVRGRNAFIWRGRLLPIGLPLAAAAGFATWQRRRSPRDTFDAVVAVALASYLEARVEWSLRRRAYWRRRGDD